MKIKKLLRVLLIAFIFLIPLLTYVVNFHSFEISNNPIDWGVFGDYIGGVYSVLVAVLAVMLTRSLSKKDERLKKRTSAAENLYHQIVQVQKQYNQKSITKMVNDIKDSELYLANSLIKELIQLYDSYQSKHDRTGSVDIQLEKKVLQQLKEIYDE